MEKTGQLGLQTARQTGIHFKIIPGIPLLKIGIFSYIAGHFQLSEQERPVVLFYFRVKYDVK